MDGSDVVVQPSWIRRYWAFVLRLIVWSGMAVGLGVILIPADALSGIAFVLFVLQMGFSNAFLGLIGKAYQQQVIDRKESTRRMWMVFSVQMVFLVAAGLMLLFSVDPLFALLPVFYMPARIFLAIRLHRFYEQDSSGVLYQKGRYD